MPSDYENEQNLNTSEADEQSQDETVNENLDVESDNNEVTDDESNENAYHGAPENYDFKTLEMPDGFKFSEELSNKFTPIAKKLNLSQDGANEIANLYIGILKEQQASAPETIKKFQAELQSAKQAEYEKLLNQDEEIGGGDEDKMNKYIDIANVGYKKFASKELQGLFKETGLIYHPEVVKMFHKLAKMSGDDNIQINNSPVSNETPAQILYGKKD